MRRPQSSSSPFASKALLTCFNSDVRHHLFLRASHSRSLAGQSILELIVLHAANPLCQVCCCKGTFSGSTLHDSGITS